MSFETKVKKFMGNKKFNKLSPSEKKTIKKFSSLQNKTKKIYSNAYLKAYEESGIL